MQIKQNLKKQITDLTLGKNTKVLQGTKGCRLKHKFRQQWTISSQFSFLPSMYQGVPYIAFQRGNERSNPSDLKA